MDIKLLCGEEVQRFISSRITIPHFYPQEMKMQLIMQFASNGKMYMHLPLIELPFLHMLQLDYLSGGMTNPLHLINMPTNVSIVPI